MGRFLDSGQVRLRFENSGGTAGKIEFLASGTLEGHILAGSSLLEISANGNVVNIVDDIQFTSGTADVDIRDASGDFEFSTESQTDKEFIFSTDNSGTAGTLFLVRSVASAGLHSYENAFEIDQVTTNQSFRAVLYTNGGT